MERSKLISETKSFLTEAATDSKAPPEVRSSNFGCMNCLWASAECRKGSKYQPKTVKMGGKVIPSCKAYTYYD